MNRNKCRIVFWVGAAAGLSAASVRAALVTIDNENFATVVTAGDHATFAGQTFTPNVGSSGSNDSVTANSPIPSPVALENVEFVYPDTNTNGTGSNTATSGPLYLEVFSGSGSGSAATYLGTSTNAVDILGTLTANAALENTPFDYSFADIVLPTSNTTYTLQFTTTTGGYGALASGRLGAANAGSGYTNTYSGGTAGNNATESGLAYDTRFSLTYNTVVTVVPEPISGSLASLGAAGMLLRRKQRQA